MLTLEDRSAVLVESEAPIGRLIDAPPRESPMDWGDGLCCVALLAAGLGGAALLGWYVCQMPALR